MARMPELTKKVLRKLVMVGGRNQIDIFKHCFHIFIFYKWFQSDQFCLKYQCLLKCYYTYFFDCFWGYAARRNATRVASTVMHFILL